MATISGISSSNITSRRVLGKASDSQNGQAPCRLNNPLWLWKRPKQFRPVAAAPDKLSDKVAESVKNAEQTCAEDPASGECVAAWDEVEELSAAASHARDRQKANSDPLENYCKDNPETDECRTYDN
ncbi:calvin cycle protein CP12-1, chloroplastic-like [Ipomoea triloba]|uniref:calvin cycle protein CP12-1, chloroplastic-like n=1 Tax=Ipomoea triloba TaxID=35885 RepID=UPI00125E0802|nr:calvin cycle protein CP12-1, chloroplastic-like [Ipomoea triloba]